MVIRLDVLDAQPSLISFRLQSTKIDIDVWPNTYILPTDNQRYQSFTFGCLDVSLLCT